MGILIIAMVLSIAVRIIANSFMNKFECVLYALSGYDVKFNNERDMKYKEYIIR